MKKKLRKGRAMLPFKLPIAFLFLVILSFIPVACTRHQIEVAPIEIKPIHITIDVNVKVDRALDNFFGDLDETAQEIKETSSHAK